MNIRYPYGIVLRILAAVVLTPALVIGAAYVVATRVTELPENAALRVGDTVVTEVDLGHRLDLLRALYGIEAPPDPQQADTFRRESARTVALTVMFDQAAREEGVVADDKAVREEFDKLMQSRFPGGRADFIKLLGNVGASEQDVLDELASRHAVIKLYDKITSAHKAETAVSQEEARQYFDEHPESFVQPETRHLRAIAVTDEALANQVAGRARTGVDFGQLAKESSRDDSTRDAGGDLGVVTRARLDEAFGSTAFAAPPGGIFGPVRARQNWYVGQVLEVRPAYPLRFETIAEQLRLDLQEKKGGDIWRAWVADRIRQAGIEYADKYRPTDVAPLQPGAAPAPDQAAPAGAPTPHS